MPTRSPAKSRPPRRVPLLTSFGRAQASALIASAVDFATLIGLVEAFGAWYVAGTACGAFAGAVTNFLLGRYWCFAAAHRALNGQALRYALVSGTSLVVNTAAVYSLTDGFGIQYVASRALAGVLVGVLFNFPMHRHFVFR